MILNRRPLTLLVMMSKDTDDNDRESTRNTRSVGGALNCLTNNDDDDSASDDDSDEHDATLDDLLDCSGDNLCYLVASFRLKASRSVRLRCMEA
jgi:hypothetical protein